MKSIRKKVLALLSVSVITLTACSGSWSNISYEETEPTTIDFSVIKDIEIGEEELIFNVDRTFFLYDSNTISEDNEGAEPIKEVAVTLNGTLNFSEETFEGEIKVGEFELGGNMQSYTGGKSDSGYTILAQGLNVQGQEETEGKTYMYIAEITEDLRTICIWVTEIAYNNEAEDVEREEYCVVNKDY